MNFSYQKRLNMPLIHHDSEFAEVMKEVSEFHQ